MSNKVGAIALVLLILIEGDFVSVSHILCQHSLLPVEYTKHVVNENTL